MSEDQMGAFMEDMADMAASMGMDMGDIDMSQMSGMDMGAMSEMSESMGKAFGGAGGDSGGMITESGMSGGGGGDDGQKKYGG